MFDFFSILFSSVEVFFFLFFFFTQWRKFSITKILHEFSYGNTHFHRYSLNNKVYYEFNPYEISSTLRDSINLSVSQKNNKSELIFFRESREIQGENCCTAVLISSHLFQAELYEKRSEISFSVPAATQIPLNN